MLRRLREQLNHIYPGQQVRPAQARSCPDWVEQLAEGDDAGYFAQDSEVWKVHAKVAADIAGLRALLIQAVHPGVLAGVWDHFRFREDPLGRLNQAYRWILTVSFGSVPAANQATAQLLRDQAGNHGQYRDGQGQLRFYAALDPELLLWTYLAFTDAFVVASEEAVTRHKSPRKQDSTVKQSSTVPEEAKQQECDPPVDPDAYVREWALAGKLLGVENPPTTVAELQARIAKFYDDGALCGDERTVEVVRFIRKPPLPYMQRYGHRAIFAAAVDTLPPEYREMLGLKRSRFPKVTRKIATLTLRMRRSLLDLGNSSKEAAYQRITRIHPEENHENHEQLL